MATVSQYENFKTADIIAEELTDWGVDVVFGIPGDGINGFIEALRHRQGKVKFILVRHEEAATLKACGYAKYAGKLGVCVATCGPGAIHLLNGLYDAKADNTHVLAVTGSTSFPYIKYLPRPGQARGIQIDIKPEKIGLRYPVEVGLVNMKKR